MADIVVPPIRFANARGARLAFQAFGDGPHDVVAIPPMAQNIELSWERPEITVMFDRFSRFSRYVHFDKRGTGCSDRATTSVNAIDDRVDDLRAVMDAAEVERAHFFVSSEGGPMAILFAATYPDRVLSLTLNGTGACLAPPNLTAETREAAVERSLEFAARWGTLRSPVVGFFAPSLADHEDFQVWHRRYERHSASPESLAELLELSLDVDVSAVLEGLAVPTLVIHRTNDRVVPVELGRELADRITGATLFEQDGDDHFAYAGDMHGWMDEFERFIAGSVAPRPRAVSGSVRIVTLGRFAVEIGGEAVPTSEWGSRLARQLCKRLVAARGWPVTRDELCDLLWPDEWDTRKLGARLSVRLSGVRKVLHGGVVADRQTVRLNLHEVSTDLEEFFGADTDEAIIEAYTGEFLPEDVYDDWTAGIRDEARARFAMAARSLGEISLESNPARSINLARRLLSADEYDTESHTLLVRALFAAGERREAERAHSAWKASFDELGLGVPAFSEVVSDA